MLHKAQIIGLTMDPESNTPILILKTVETDQAVPIWIGLLEATSIAAALKEIHFDRPMTHDLFKNFIESLDITIPKIEVCAIKDNTYFSKIHFVSGNGPFTMDARPSDAIALALRFHSDIYVDDQVLIASEGQEQTVEVADDSEEGRKWAEYLANLSKDDFGDYQV